MRLIKTKDGTFTCYSEEYKELYHALSGALEEAFKKYVEPCRIREYKKIKILDICFGLGYNSAASIFEVLKKNGEIKIIGLEKDKKILETIRRIKFDNEFDKAYDIIKEVSKKGYYKNKNVEIRLIVGDARKTIKKINDRFDAVFLDPFSFRKNHELWTLEFFREIKKKIKEMGILSTYSCAASVRKTMLEAGFNICNGPIVGGRYGTLGSVRRDFKLKERDMKIVEIFGEVLRDRFK